MGGERTLNVYWNQRLVGHLIQDLGGQMLFTYHSSWLDDSQTSALSQSLPLRSESFGRNECRPFFAGILPEESQRERIAATLGISARNDFALLSAIGGECAGAVTFLESEPVAELPSAGYRPLEEQELAEILRKIRQHPLMAGEEGVRLSLAGAQDKLAVLVEDGAVSIPLNGAASTHVIREALTASTGDAYPELAEHIRARCELFLRWFQS